jgi:hypothetical protein
VLWRAGRSEEALEMCVDAMAMGRDLIYSHNIHAVKYGVAMMGWIASTCAEVVDAASVASKRRAQRQVASIASAVPSFETIMKTARLRREAISFGPLIPRERIQGLPLEARLILLANASTASTGAWWTGITERRRWLESVAVDNYTGPLWSATRKAKKRAYLDAIGRFEHEFLAEWEEDMSAEDYYRADLTRLNVLQALSLVDGYQAQHGRWPRTLEEALLPGMQLVDRRTGAALRLGGDGRTIEAVCQAACGDGDLGDPIRLIAHPDEGAR